MTSLDSFHAKSTLTAGGTTYTIHRLDAIEKAGVTRLSRLPFSLRILLENLLRLEDGAVVTQKDIETLARWAPGAVPDAEVAFTPARVILQDFTGVPCVVDLAAMRDAIVERGGDPLRVNPLQEVDLVIDHSVQVDHFGTRDAFSLNVAIEYERNRERYAFLRWGQRALRNFRVVPPGTGIVHQVNLEHLAHVVLALGSADGKPVLCPDTLVGTDSHTTMINGLGVLGWGVGGIEAEAAMLGQPFSLKIPEVVGFKLHGKLREGATATDLVLTVTEMLRTKGVVEKFVEFYGPGLSSLSLADRATVANMAPEYGATCGFFPVDDETLAYLRLTGRGALCERVERYSKEQGLFRSAETPDPEFSDTLALDLGAVEPSLAGPKRPQDRVALGAVKTSFAQSIADRADADRTVAVEMDGQRFSLENGAVVIAAITSCTNTSNPSVMIAAGLVAKKAVERGLARRPWVKTSLAPGSKVVVDYLRAANLLDPLEALGFHLVGFGCTTCIGNSGPLPPAIAEAVQKSDLVVAAVLSGNRNFEGRVHPQVRANYLASPPLVVAYALAGGVGVDLHADPIGKGRDGRPVFLRDIWPSTEEVRDTVRSVVKAEMFEREYAHVFEGDDRWKKLAVPEGSTYAWDAKSTYIRRAPYFDAMPAEPAPLADIAGARVLVMVGDSITTDHMSPAGSIDAKGPAGRYLVEHGVSPKDFNSYGARRGNHELMARGTFGNIRLKNLLAPGTEGGVTTYLPSGEVTSIFEASERYRKDKTPLVVLAGKEYGSGSSRDWAAKGPALLGIRAVLAESFERIHRSNLVGMGILPLVYEKGASRASLGLDGHERYDVEGIREGLAPGKVLTVRAHPAAGRDGPPKVFRVVARVDTPREVDYVRHGGILCYVLRQMLRR